MKKAPSFFRACLEIRFSVPPSGGNGARNALRWNSKLTVNVCHPLFVNVVALASLVLLAAACATGNKTKLQRQTGESVVFVGEEPATLAFLPAGAPISNRLSPTPLQPFSLRSTYLPESNRIVYVEGLDYLVDYPGGTLRRTPASRIPDFGTNMLFGRQEFDHTKFPGFGNNGYFVFVDYSLRHPARWPVQANETRFLKSIKAKLNAGGGVKIVAFGDSITAGGEASKPDLIFWRRWADYLQRRYPRARVRAVNGATGGDSTVQGLQRLQAKVLDEKPDLVLIGFGMNDHNVGSVPVPQFQDNLKQMIARIRHETGAEIILLSAFPPNPRWKFGTHHMQDYAAATRLVARQTSCACADVFNNWQSMAARKKPEDLLGNNINHPNDFGHWIYFQVLQKLGL
jgi:acyl-CoA thioesterase I